MKKLYFSPVLFFAVLLFLLFYPMTFQYAASPSKRSFESLKTMRFSKSTSPIENDIHRVWLNLTSAEGIYKQLLIGYIAGATNGWDSSFDALAMDAYKLANFYSINENKKLAIQGRALPIELTDNIPLGYRSAIIGNLTISIDRADGDLSEMDIYVLDKETGTSHNLKNGGYTFSTQIGTFNNRFEIRYKAEQKLGTNHPVNISQELAIVSRSNIISLRSGDVPLSEVSVFDITGKLLHNSQKIGASDLEITNIQSGDQILIVKTILENGKTITKKVFF